MLAESERCRRTGEPFRAEYRMLAGDGRVVWVQDEATVVRDEAGRPLYYQGLLLDLTDRKRAEEERRRLRGRLVSAQEEERARIAADIHDDPIQKMSAREGGPPIWIGAHAERAVRRAAQLADGFLAGEPTVEEFDLAVGWIRDELARSEREASAFDIGGYWPIFTWDDMIHEYRWAA